jgi:hypothetical protein
MVVDALDAHPAANRKTVENRTTQCHHAGAERDCFENIRVATNATVHDGRNTALNSFCDWQ